MISNQPFNVKIMDIDAFVERNYCLPVRSHQIYEASSTKLHPEGLFSEQIFGEIGSDARLVKFGYIPLNTTVFHPSIFLNIVSMRGLYKDIMASKTYVYFDDETNDFVVCTKDHPDAGTGFQYFVENFKNIKFKHTSSKKRDIKIRIFEKYKDLLMIDKCLVLPAGIRDLEVSDDGRTTSEEINTFYQSLLSMSFAIPKEMGSHPIFNSIRYNIQIKVHDIYNYITDLVSGKRGFGQSKYMARRLVYGTRNVFTSALLEAKNPEDPKYLKYDETLVPLFQACKMFQPIIEYHLRHFFYNHLFDTNANKIAAINKDNYNLGYIEVSDTEKTRYMSDEGLGLIIDRFLDEEKRMFPVTIKDVNDKEYYVALIYDKGDKIYVTRSASEFITQYNEGKPESEWITAQDFRPMTHMEMMYITAYPALLGSHMLNTRYPVAHVESIYPSKVHLATTSPSRTITLHDLNNEDTIMLPEYPVLDAQHVDALALHHCWLANLKADFDGDMGNGTGIITENANKEIAKYMDSSSSIVNTRGELVAGITDDTLVPYVLLNMSRRRIKKPLDLQRFSPSLSRVRHMKTYLDIMPIHESIIIGSGFLALLGLTTNDDLDCIVSEHIWDIMGLSKRFVYDPKKNEYHTEDKGLSVWSTFLGKMTFDDFINDAVIFDSVAFLHPRWMYKFYKTRNAEKDKPRIALLEKYFKDEI